MSGGTESRTQIIPTKEPEDTGFVLPNYDINQPSIVSEDRLSLIN